MMANYMTQSKKLIFILALLFIINYIPSAVGYGSNDNTIILAADDISLEIDYGNSSTRIIQNLSGPNVLNITQSIAEVELYYDVWGYAFVTGIDGISSNSNNEMYWQYWVNGAYASSASNVFILQDGDVVSWRFVSSQVDYTGNVIQEPSTFFGIISISLIITVFLGVLYHRRRM